MHSDALPIYTKMDHLILMASARTFGQNYFSAQPQQKSYHACSHVQTLKLHLCLSAKFLEGK